MPHHISQTNQHSFVSLTSLSAEMLEAMERMNSYAYANFAAQTKPWPAGKFVQKLASYGHVALVHNHSTQHLCCFLAYSSPTIIAQSKSIKAGPLGFASDVCSPWQKVALLRGIIAAWIQRFPDTLLWAELPEEATVLERILLQQGWRNCDDASLARALLASAGVQSSSLLLRPDAVCYEFPSKGYVQKIVYYSPSDMGANLSHVSSPILTHEI